MAQRVKNPPASRETWVQSLGWECPLEKGTATHFSTLAWRIPLSEESGKLQSMGSKRVGHDWVTFTFTPSSPLFPGCSLLSVFCIYQHPNIFTNGPCYQVGRYSLWDANWVWPSTEQPSITTFQAEYIFILATHPSHILIFLEYCLFNHTKCIPPSYQKSTTLEMDIVIIFVLFTLFQLGKRKETEESFFLLKILCLEVSHFGLICRKSSQTQSLTSLLSPNSWAYFTKNYFKWDKYRSHCLRVVFRKVHDKTWMRIFKFYSWFLRWILYYSWKRITRCFNSDFSID